MQTCGSHGGIFVYDDPRGCPVCRELDALECENSDLNDEVEELSKDVRRLEAERGTVS